MELQPISYMLVNLICEGLRMHMQLYTTADQRGAKDTYKPLWSAQKPPLLLLMV